MSLKEETTDSSLAVKDVSKIREYFSGKTVLLTGATGFLGKLILEKLLRSCNDIEKIYILVRLKKNVEPERRFTEMFDVKSYDIVKKQNPNFTSKITICVGDCLLPDLGLSQEDREMLKTNVNCVIHCAATVRFDASLRKATYINVRAVRDLLKLAKEMKNLTSFVHVSTAYSNCPRKDIDEIYYDPIITPQKLLDLVEMMNDDLLDAITPGLLSGWPNTYSLTKAIAEDLVRTEGKGLPFAIVRPSIIICSNKEPLPGWVDSIYGPTGLIFLAGLGLLRTMHCDEEKRTDMVPCDLVTNTVIAIAGKIGQTATAPQNTENVPIIFNCVSGASNSLTWHKFINYTTTHGNNHTPLRIVWYPFWVVTKNKYYFSLLTFLLHVCPAYLVDLVCRLIKKKPIAMEISGKVAQFLTILEYFCMNEWNFKDENLRNLWNQTNALDRELFPFDIKLVDWNEICKIYIQGIRTEIMKDPLDTVPQARRKRIIFKVVHYVTVTILCLLLYKLLQFIFNIIF